jgi:Zn-dependent protease with chaperone function
VTLAIALGLLAVLLFGPAGIILERSKWPSRAPRAAIALWQSIGLAGGLAAIGAGLAVTVAPLHTGLTAGLGHLVTQAANGHPLAGLGLNGALGLTLAADVGIVLAGGMALTSWRTLRARSRHRALLDLVSIRSERAPGALLLDHPDPTAYCLPGLRSRIVLSAGTLGLLHSNELAAVMAHEKGHVHERHDLVLLPLASMSQLLRWMPYVRLAPTAVATLVEMAADDFASRSNDPVDLASALVHMVSANASPWCALAATETNVTVRVHRLLRPARPSRSIATLAVLGTIAVLAVPVAALLAPSVPL